MKHGGKSYPRRQRIESLVLRGLSPLVSRVSPAATVRRITLNGDYSVGTVHYAVLAGDADAVHQLLSDKAALLRRQLAASLNMRSTPRLVFAPDEEGVAADAMREKLESMARQDADVA